jgi:hypothetical protein
MGRSRQSGQVLFVGNHLENDVVAPGPARHAHRDGPPARAAAGRGALTDGSLLITHVGELPSFFQAA